MELEYSCEIGESEMVALAMRPFQRSFRNSFVYAGFAWLLVAARGVSWFLCDSQYDGENGILRALLIAVVFLAVCLKYWRLRWGFISAFQARKTNLAEIRITDQAISTTLGETTSTAPWHEFSKFLIDDAALYLWTHTGVVACVPGWSGHGVEPGELASILEKAGLKNGKAGKARRLLFDAIPAMFGVCMVVLAYTSIRDAWRTFHQDIVRVELSQPIASEVACPTDGATNDMSFWDCAGCGKDAVPLVETEPGGIVGGEDGPTAIWLISPWKDVVMSVFILGPLVAICALHWCRPRLFSSFWKCALWALGISLWSWLIFGGSMFLSIAVFHDYPDNGAAVAFAYSLGWLYIWPFALAVGLAYLLARMLAKVVARAKSRLGEA